jgi:hypothetical protein
MAYESMWEDLAEARSHFVASTGCSQEEAETDIGRAIADGAVNFQGELKLHTTRAFKARGTVLNRTAFQLPREIGRSDLDWEKSSPRQAWYVRRDQYKLPGYWELERIRLFKADVRRALCTAGEDGNSTKRDSRGTNTAGKIRTAPEDTGACVAGDPNLSGRSQDRVVSPRRCGRRPVKFNATVEAMRQDLRAGKITAAALGNTVEKNLAATYGVSRDTARKARDAVLSEIPVPNSRQKPTNDK